MKTLLVKLTLMTLLLTSSRVFSQQKEYGANWVNGLASPIYKTEFTTSGTLNTQINLQADSLTFFGGHSCISDSLGNLLLISNGLSLLNAQGSYIDGGYKLVSDRWFERASGGNNNAQGSILLPVANSRYCFICEMYSDYMLDNEGMPGFEVYCDELWYSVTDMKLNSGAGKVIKRKIPLVTGAKMAITELTACRHGDGKSWWLTKQARDTNLIYKFLITQDTVYGPYLQGFSQPKFGIWDNGGQSVFSKDGTRYATTARGAYKVFVADFNRCTGMMSNPLVYDVPAPTITYPNGSSFQDSMTESVAFSPNGRFLYVGKFAAIMQLDLQDNNPLTQWDTIARLDTTWAAFAQYAAIYLGPDDKIYIGNWNGVSSQMSMITNPDAKGAACGFCPRCMRFPGSTPVFSGNVNGPPNITNYKLGAANPICWATPVEEVDKPVVLKVHPNPTSGWVTLEYEAGNTEDLTLQITDVYSRLVYETALDAGSTQKTFNLSAQPSGVYGYKVMANGVQRSTGKIVLVR